MALNVRPNGWSIEKLDAFNDLTDTAQAFLVLDRVLTAANDNSAAAFALRADLVTQAKAQLVRLKAL
jgi:glutamate-1-semialdehyde aminotransferase